MIDSCAAPGLTPVETAIEHLLSAVKPITETIEVPVQDALGYVLAQDQISTIDVLPADNSAMDGYALRLQDCQLCLEQDGKIELVISQRITAGDEPELLADNTCARIFTGAAVPENADIVVMQEQCEIAADGERQQKFSTSFSENCQGTLSKRRIGSVMISRD